MKKFIRLLIVGIFLIFLQFNSTNLFGAPNTPVDVLVPLPVCPGTSATITVIQTGGADGFAWDIIGDSWSVASSTTSSTFNTITAGPESATLNVWAFDTFGNSGTFTKIIPQLGDPDEIFSESPFHCTSNTMSYWINPVELATDYHWSISGDNWSISSASGTICDIVGGTGNAILSVYATNLCDTSETLTYEIIPKPAPTFINATLSGPHCAGTSNTYTIDPIPGATSYSWYLESNDPGWSATSSTTTAFVVNSGTATVAPATIYVAANNICGSSATISKTLDPLGAPTGLVANPPGDHCLNTSKTYTVIPVEHANYYEWWFSGGEGWSATSNTIGYIVVNTSTFTMGNATVSVAAVNDCGTSRTYTTTIELIYSPSQPGDITKPEIHCIGTAENYSVEPVQQARSYYWAINNPNWSVSGTSNVASVVAGEGSATLTVLALNDCGISFPTQTVVTPWYGPSSPTITTPEFHCYNDTVKYSAPTDTYATSWQWTVQGEGWSATSSTTSRTCDIVAGPESGTISVIAIGPCDTSSVYSVEISPSFLPEHAPAQIYQPGNHCEGTVKPYACDTVANATSYLWVVNGTGWEGHSTTNFIDIKAGSDIATITVYAVTACGLSDPTTIMVIPNRVPQEVFIDKPGEHCTGTIRTYSAYAPKATSYTWYIQNDPNAEIPWTADHLTTKDVNLRAGSSSATISILASNDCGNGALYTFIVTPNTPPAQPGAITGPTVHCEASWEEYSIDTVADADIYMWSVTGEGWEVESSNTTEVDILAGKGTGTISVVAINHCGESQERTLTVIPDTLLAAPTKLNKPSVHCQGQTQTYSVDPVPGAQSYKWTLNGNGWTSSSSNTNNINIIAGTGSAELTCIAINDCGNGAPLTATINSVPIPSSEFNINRDTVCRDETVTVTYTGNAGPNAQFNWDFDGGQATPGTGKGPHTVMWYNNPGLRTIKLIVTENGCPSQQKLVSVFVDNCTGVKDNFSTKEFEIIPNPSEGMINIKLNKTQFNFAKLQIINNLGQVVYSEQLQNITNNFTHEINLNQLGSGSYYVKISSNGKELIERLIIFK